MALHNEVPGGERHVADAPGVTSGWGRYNEPARLAPSATTASGGRPRSLPDAASRVQGIHRQLFEFIETGNAEAAGRLMRTHIADIRAKHVQANADAAPAGDCC